MTDTPIYDTMHVGSVQAFVVSAIAAGYPLRRPSPWSYASVFYPHDAADEK